MARYLNPASEAFQESLRSKIYVDKSLLISELNDILSTDKKYMCVSRPRRFGKSMALKMIGAYYQSAEDTHYIFDNLKIAKVASYEQNINKYEVVWLNMQMFFSEAKFDVEAMIECVENCVISELTDKFAEAVRLSNTTSLVQVLANIYEQTRRKFVFLIDEWDCVMRATNKNEQQQEIYLDYLRKILKDQTYVALAYMTGILPIKKYGNHSALNMFSERSITSPGSVAEYFGFTEEETQELCKKYNRNYDEVQKWYDGYELKCITNGVIRYTQIFNPNSVVCAMVGEIENYWGPTERLEALRKYIDLDFEGLRTDVTKMLVGERVRVDISLFANDMQTFNGKDDILTLLIHLGYLTYDAKTKRAYIPNYEVADEFRRALNVNRYHAVAEAVEQSSLLLEAIWNRNEQFVSEALRKAHEEIPIFNYNDENSLSCAIMLAMYSAREYYSEFRELPTGQGFADIVYIPSPLHAEKPAIVVELKWDKSANSAIAQIKAKNYAGRLQAYKSNILLVGINYDKDSRQYECIIEEA